jgi:hypothetical protein
MSNTNNPHGFVWVQNSSGATVPFQDTVTLAGTVAKGDALVMASGTATIALYDSGLILGVAAQAGDSGDVIQFYPAVPWNVFEAQCSGTYAVSSYKYTAVDIEGGTGEQMVDENANNEKVFQITGHNPNDSVGAYTRVRGIFVRSSYTGLEDAET